MILIKDKKERKSDTRQEMQSWYLIHKICLLATWWKRFTGKTNLAYTGLVLNGKENPVKGRGKLINCR